MATSINLHVMEQNQHSPQPNTLKKVQFCMGKRQEFFINLADKDSHPYQFLYATKKSNHPFPALQGRYNFYVQYRFREIFIIAINRDGQPYQSLYGAKVAANFPSKQINPP